MPLFWLALAFLTGIVFSSINTLTSKVWLMWSVLPLLLFWLPLILRNISNKVPSRLIRYFQWMKHPIIKTLFDVKKETGMAVVYFIPMIMLALFLGAARYQGSIPEISEAHIAWYNNIEGNVKIVGFVERPPEIREYYVNLWIDVENVEIETEPQLIQVEGKVLAQIPLDSKIQYGDQVLLVGKLKTPQEVELFSYKEYLARQGIYSTMSYAEVYQLNNGGGSEFLASIYSIKENALNLVYRFFPDPEASLMAGILLGVETGISKDVKQAFQDTGTSHIIAISGFNITIVAGLFSALFGRVLGRRRGAFVAVVGIGVYTILVGADAAVVRAAIMGGLSLFARQVGRRQDGLNSLAITAAVMNIFNPMLLWDVGFQLSFMATLGLVLFADPFKRKFEIWIRKWVDPTMAKRLSGPVGEYFLFTIAAQIMILPVVIYHFQRISLSSIPANIAILPAQPFVMILGGFALLMGGIFFPLGQMISYLAWPFVAYSIRVVEWFSQFRGGVLVFGQIGLFFVFVYYFLMFVSIIWGERIREKISDFKPVLILFVLAVITISTWQTVLNAPDGNLHVTLMDVGTGDAVLIQSPDGRFILVNGGPSINQLSDELGRWLPLFHRKLDFLVIASTEENQIKSLPTLTERFLPSQVLWAGKPNASRSGRFLEQTLTDLQIPILPAETGQVLDLGQGAVLRVLATGSRGAILLLEWKDFRMLMPLGMSFEEMDQLLMGKSIGPVSALILAENGYGPLNPPEWIKNLHPELILLSVAAGDYEGLPSWETMQAIAGYQILRTDLNGWINLESDGQKIWVDVER